jgi:hypothetical protein
MKMHWTLKNEYTWAKVMIDFELLKSAAIWVEKRRDTKKPRKPYAVVHTIEA